MSLRENIKEVPLRFAFFGSFVRRDFCINHDSTAGLGFQAALGGRLWQMNKYLVSVLKLRRDAQITTAQVAFSDAHLRFTTAQIVINCTLK